jgi:type I restriction enzyme S subunit
LLKRIQAEKGRLIAEGKIKKDKPLPAIKDEEVPFFLPQGWEWARLPDIYYPLSVSANKLLSSEINEAGKFPVVDQGQRYIAGYTDNYDLLISLPGPVVIFGDHTTARKLVDFDFVAGADGVKILRPLLQNEKFFWWQLVGFKLEGRGYARHFKILNECLYALPPLPEQVRIVAKVDELMALCDQLESEHNNATEAHEKLVSHLLGTLTQSQSAEDFSANWQRIATHFDTLFTTEASIDALKQALLQLAVMGKLVPQDPNDEPASELLKRIQAEKAELIAEGKIKKEKPLPPLTGEEMPFYLPPGWKFSRFSDYATDIATGPFGSMIHQSDYVKGGVPLINPSHMIDDKIYPDEAISVSMEMANILSSYTIYDGDIVMARRGEVGRIALVTNEENGWLCGTGSFVLRFCAEVPRHYLRVFFRCNYARTYLAGEAIGTTMVNLNHGILKKMPIGLPPAAEQHRIVAKVDELMALCDRFKSRLTEASQLQQKLADVLVVNAVSVNGEKH